MLKTLADAFKIKEIRMGILFDFLILCIVRLGCAIPTPGIKTAAVAQFFENNLGDSFSFLNSFTGGSFSQMSIFALNVTPYITSSIIIQLLTIAIPALEEMQNDGEEGRKKMTALTRFVSIALAVIESLGLCIGFGRGGYLDNYNFWGVSLIIITLTAGSAVVMWLGERITDKGIGNGISLILTCNIVSRMPSDFSNLYQMFVKDKSIVNGIVAAVIIIVVVVLTTVLVVILQDAERRVPIQYSQKMQGRKSFGGRTTNIPIKVNTAGVIPIIFASTLLQFPSVVISLCKVNVTNKVASSILQGLNSNYWFNPSYPWATIGLILYIVLVVFFAYFYTTLTFNPALVSQNLKKNGGFIPGIRPGKPTQDYLNKVLNYIVLIGVIGLIIVAIIPIFFNGMFGANVSFGGTSLIIIVGVVIETIKQIESKMVVRNYSGFLGSKK